MKKTFLKDEFEKGLATEVKDAILSCARVADKFDFKIFLIGGVVRDLILGNQIFDIDIIVEGNAVKFASLISKELNCDIVQVQKELKTAKVVFKSGVEIDFASTRCEAYSASGMLPVINNIECSLEEDVKRRDFSVNSMAMSLNKAEKFMLVDYLDGKKALDAKELSILHSKSFIDDPSRIIRGLKFVVRFGFDFSSDTKNLLNEYLEFYINPDMPLERIRGELEQLFNLNLAEAYDEFISSGAWKLIAVKPDIKLKGEQIKKVVDPYYQEGKNIWLIYLACAVINEDKNTLKKLNLSAKEVRIISDAKELINGKLEDNDFAVYKYFVNKAKESVLIYYIFKQNKSAIRFLKELSKIKILISGGDLIKLGITPSPKFAEIFDKILYEKINRNVKTKEEEIEIAKTFL